MMELLLPLHDGLHEHCRVAPFRLMQRDARWHAIDLGILGLAGFAAAVATVLIDMNLRIPGSAVFRSVFPLVCGLGLVPRRRAGSFMGATALTSALLMQSLGFGDAGLGALTSLTLTGPLLDAALSRAKRGQSIFLAFAAAGLLSNMAAFVVRGASKLGSSHLGGERLFEMWIGPATISYPLCGALAGLLSAFVWFQISPRNPRSEQPLDV